jgi:hypothetical protein
MRGFSLPLIEIRLHMISENASNRCQCSMCGTNLIPQTIFYGNSLLSDLLCQAFPGTLGSVPHPAQGGETTAAAGRDS